jgi:hypothetical protein
MPSEVELKDKCSSRARSVIEPCLVKARYELCLRTIFPGNIPIPKHSVSITAQSVIDLISIKPGTPVFIELQQCLKTYILAYIAGINSSVECRCRKRYCLIVCISILKLSGCENKNIIFIFILQFTHVMLFSLCRRIRSADLHCGGED